MHSYSTIISPENLFVAWEEFLRGKRKREDVADFSLRLAENVLNLHKDLKNGTYAHGPYEAFGISDPKPRKIHKATVRDRLLHHAIVRVLYPCLDKRFIYDSYSCRDNKGTHKAMDRFLQLFRRASQNNKETCWVLKCDIRKFFASVDHGTLFRIVAKHNVGLDTQRLLKKIVDSFTSGVAGKGLPLGNLTSQLLVNVYMNELDQFIKHELKERCYIRFADDFVLLDQDRMRLDGTLATISDFLKKELVLDLHPDKVFIKSFASGVDFLGWVHFPNHRVLRTSTKRRMLKALRYDNNPSSRTSYLGMLKHGNTYGLQGLIG